MSSIHEFHTCGSSLEACNVFTPGAPESIFLGCSISINLIPSSLQAIIGMNIFGNVKWQTNIDRDANFETFPSAMMLLFR